MYIIMILDAGEWKTASIHSQETDARLQLARFIASGIAPANLKLIDPAGNEI